MECQCDKAEDAVSGWWTGSNPIQMGAFTVVGYLLYRFSQTLPALIRWPIRVFCSLTGLSALWSWVSRLVGTIRVIKTLFKWMSQLWKFIVAFSSKFKRLNAAIRLITESSEALESESCSPYKPGLRLILLGPSGGGRSSLAHTLMGNTKTKVSTCPLMESTKRTTVVEGREVTVIDTPDLLGLSLENSKRAREALRSLQLASPGPHAFLLVTRAPGSSKQLDQEASQEIRATLDLFGNEVSGHIIPVLTHADRLRGKRNVDQLLESDTGDLRKAVALCGQRPELVDNRPDGSPETQSVTRRQLLERVMEMKELRGHFIHELQEREDRVREELLTDMASALAQKLGHTYK